MADFTDKLALGTSRMNPSSMVPGAMGGNAPQGGFSTQSAAQPGRTSVAQSQAQMDQRRQQIQQLAQQLQQNPPAVSSGVSNKIDPRMFMPPSKGPSYESKRMTELHANTPQPNAQAYPYGMGKDVFKMAEMYNQRKSQSDLPTETQQMLPNKNEKKSSGYKKEDFSLLSDVFKTLSER